MVPRLTVFQKIFAWLLFKYEGFEDLDDAQFNIERHSLKSLSRMREYLYYRRSKAKK